MIRKVSWLWILLLGLLSAGSGALKAQSQSLSDLDALRYIASHPDLIIAFGADAEKGRRHYENWGLKEGRKITFDPQVYLARYDDVRAAFGNDLIAATKHYIQFGFKEGRIFSPLEAVELSFSLSREQVPFGNSVVLSWSAKYAVSCIASGAWSGTLLPSGSLSVTPNSTGRLQFNLECKGLGGTVQQSRSLLVSFPLFATSYENRNLLPIDSTQVPSVRALGLKLDADEQDTAERAITFGDFLGEGSVAAFVSVSRSRNVHGIANISDSVGKAYLLAQNAQGQWIDRTAEIFKDAASRETCVTVSSAITADFNNDGKPDIFLSCEGLQSWHQLPNGEHQGTHPKYSEIYLSNQLLFLSTAGKTYTRVDVPIRAKASSASAGDVNRDGKIDVVLANISMVPGEGGEPIVLLGQGDGLFTRVEGLIPRRYQPSGRWINNDIGWTHFVHLLPVDGRLDAVLIGGNGAAWLKGNDGGFDTWTIQQAAWPISPRTGKRYWPSDLVRAADGFYLPASTGLENGAEWVLLKTDFSSKVVPIFPVLMVDYRAFQPVSSRIKLAADGSIVSYTGGCGSVQTGMCAMRVNGKSLQTLSDIDTLKYVASHGDLIEVFGTDVPKARLHYEQWGSREGRRITFDPLLYVASHPDLMLAFGVDQEEAAIKHYINFGHKERRATAIFDPLRYTASNGDVLRVFGFDFEAVTRNYILFGHAEGRTTDFDGLAYIASHADLIDVFKTDVVSAIKHYIRYGFQEGRRVTFNALAYIASYVDLLIQFGSDVVAATKHYIEFGYKEGRRVAFDAAAYLAANADLRSVFGADPVAATRHYISWGFVEKRPTARPPASPVSRLDAHRFLVQTTFGPTDAGIERLLELGYSGNGYERWIDEQIRKPISLSLPATVAAVPKPRPASFNPDHAHKERKEVWFKNVLYGEDQLRQRVAWALSQIMVVSGTGALFQKPWATADYYDMLARNAFGNYRQLLEDVTLHPAMGVYLSALGNRKAVEGTNLRPDENYAREMMQLFSIGLVQLNLDGSRMLDQRGEPIPTYDQQTIGGFARVFTGFNWQCSTRFFPNGGCSWQGAGEEYWPEDALRLADFNQTRPMKLFEEQHESGSKQLLKYPGVALPDGLVPAGQGGMKDLKDALDNVFYHPNVGPFISKQLIQKLVTSNPSPDYVRRVATVFNSDSQGVRGNLEAVIKAILLDPEARIPSQDAAYGKLKEPLLRLTQLWRAYDGRTPSGVVGLSMFGYEFGGPLSSFGQSPLESPSVFNFFSPFYSPPGEIAQGGLVSPEMQLANENIHTEMHNFFFDQIQQLFPAPMGNQVTLDKRDPKKIYMNFGIELAVADDVDRLLDVVSARLLGDPSALQPETRSEFRTQLGRTVINVNQTSFGNYSRADHFADQRRWRILDTLYLVATSPEYAVQQ